MPNLNKVMLIGNLTRDPELRYTPKGTAVAEIAMAINRVWNNDAGQKQEETTFVDVTLWGRQAELVQQYVTKGQPIYIEGRLHLETWDDKETGKKRSRMKVIGESMQFLSTRSESGGQQQPPQQRQRPQQSQRMAPAPPADDTDEDDDIPF